MKAKESRGKSAPADALYRFPDGMPYIVSRTV